MQSRQRLDIPPFLSYKCSCTYAWQRKKVQRCFSFSLSFCFLSGSVAFWLSRRPDFSFIFFCCLRSSRSSCTLLAVSAPCRSATWERTQRQQRASTHARPLGELGQSTDADARPAEEDRCCR